ncbi:MULTISPECIES: hypothetical protein [unclassified Arthrobacter]|uniref:hypothetical protein n=1 Tax=unclassified Arthrobacter TaxID=235627 RepID=UPI0033952D5A
MKGRTKAILLVAAAWTVAALIAVLGVTAWQTICYYMEPVADTIADPGSYSLAAYSGLLALALSVAVSVGITLHAARCRHSPTA